MLEQLREDRGVRIIRIEELDELGQRS